jgi:spore maturation protein SpmA
VNIVFFALVAIAFAATAVRQIGWTAASPKDVAPMQHLAVGMIDAAASSVTLALGLVGVMALFLGLMKVAEAGGLLTIIARLVRPLMVRLFPEVPAEHPAMGAMIMNMSANALGLGNAATPFGIRAMQELDTLNPVKGTASNAMVLFLAINTSSVTLLPTGVIALRAAAGSQDPAGILPTTLFATILSTTVAILAVKLYQRFAPMPDAPVGLPDQEQTGSTEPSPALDKPDAVADVSGQGYPGWVSYLALGIIAALVPLTVIYGKTVAPWIIPGLMLGFLTFGMARRVRIYEVFVEGARDGFQVAIRIIPYLVAILVAVGMLRTSGALDLFVGWVGPVTSAFGMPGEALPMALLRPLSGSGAYGILASIIQDPAIGPDSYAGYLVSTLQGSTETTFYVLAVYFGAVQIRRVRHALAAALTADVAGIIGAILACTVLYGTLS